MPDVGRTLFWLGMKEKAKSLTKSAALVTLMVLGFKVLGFIKQSVVAFYFGATAETDAYFTAYGFVSGISDALIGSLSISVVALYTQTRIQEGKEQAAKLINALICMAFPTLILLAGILFAASPLCARILAPAYDSEGLSTVSEYIRILVPFLLFVAIQFTLTAVLDSHKSFFVSRMESFFYSVSVILSCVFLSGIFGVKSLVLARYASGVGFCLLIIISAGKFHKFFLANPIKNPLTKTILLTALPLFIGNSVLQINEIVDKAIASGLGEGATSALYYCQVLEQFVSRVAIATIGNVLLASFAENVAKKENDKVVSILKKAINIILCFLAGVSVITIFCARDIVEIVFFRGNFTIEAVDLASVALIGYAIAFAAVAVRELSARGLYAFQDTKHPMITSIIAIALNITLSIILSRFMGLFGIALATSISAMAGMVINALFLKKHIPEYKYLYHGVTFLKCIPGLIVLAILCFVIQRFIVTGPIVRFAVATVLGFAIYIPILYLMGISEVRQYVSLGLKKLRRKRNQ